LDTSKTRVSSRKVVPNYTPDFKLQVAIAACEPDISVSKLALELGLNANMVFKWCRQYRAGQLRTRRSPGEAILLPVAVQSESAVELPVISEPVTMYPPAHPVSSASSIEIELHGAKASVCGLVDPVHLRLVLPCLNPL